MGLGAIIGGIGKAIGTAKIEEIRSRLGIEKPVIQPKKIVKEEIKKKPLGLSIDENRFKSKLKEASKCKQIVSTQSQTTLIHTNLVHEWKIKIICYLHTL